MLPGHCRTTMQRHVVSDLDDMQAVAALFDPMPDVVFSVKDLAGRYVAMSEACVARCQLRDPREAVGKTAHDLFPGHMADRYRAQDQIVFDRGHPISNNIDLTVYNDRKPGWCVSHKQPVHDRAGRLVGLVCISRDLIEPSREGLVDARFARAVDFIQSNYDRPLCLDELTLVSGLSVAQLDRRMKRVFLASTGEFIRRTRLEAALYTIVNSRRAMADIAAACGFSDQSALHRQCRQALGLSPRQLRAQAQQVALAG